MIKFNEYTWYSKLAAIIFFIAVLPAWTFYLGTQYEKTAEIINQSAIISDNLDAAYNAVPHTVAYGYRCDDGSEFTLTPNQDMSSIHIIPATSVDIIPDTTVTSLPDGSHTRYEGGGVSLFGNGQNVNITVGESDAVIKCKPMLSKNQKPLVFQD